MSIMKKQRRDSVRYCVCKRCDWEWWARIKIPAACPRCHSPYWDKEKGGDSGNELH